jgi:ABC-type antimicrobial peptide transport system permease subunit
VIPISYSLRSLLVRRASSVASVLGLALVVFVLAAALMLHEGALQAGRRAPQPSGVVLLRKGAATELESRLVATSLSAVRAANGVARDELGQPMVVGELIVVIILDVVDGNGVSNVQLRGVDGSSFGFRPALHIVEGRAPRDGSDEAVVGRGLVGQFRELGVGGRIDLAPHRPLRIVGVFEDGGSAYESEIWTDAQRVRDAFAMGPVVSSARVRLTSADAFDDFRAAIERDRTLSATAVRDDALFERQSQGTAGFLAALGGIVAALFGIGATLGAMITLQSAVAQRTCEIGVLRALGFSRFQVLSAFLFEAVLLALVGGFVGVVLALLLSGQRMTILNTATWSTLSFAFEPSASVLVTAFGVAAVMGVAGGLVPALRASRIDPARAMR